MPAPSTRRITVSTPLFAAICGGLIGLGAIAVSAALWRAGQTHLAAMTSQASLLLALVCLAAFVLLAQPPRRRRARVTIDRFVPQAWLPPDPDPVPVLAICAGLPLVTGATAAVILFH